MRIELIKTDEERLACFEVLKELRPALVRERFLEDLRRMGMQGFTLAAVWDPDVRAVAGFRQMEMFATGPALYIDDLVTVAAHRSHGYGAALLSFLEKHAQGLGCKYVDLDSGMQRLEAHRFYRREGFEEIGLHFSKPTGDGPRWKASE